MAATYAPEGIRVNAVAPGLTRTPMSRRAQADDAILAFAPTKQPLTDDGFVEPEDVAAACAYLCSDDARLVTGQVLAVDAGWRVTTGRLP
jgi:NAD(P)-dependent dehydrogenase (short-subunit alcohol dehydrogenase family)